MVRERMNANELRIRKTCKCTYIDMISDAQIKDCVYKYLITEIITTNMKLKVSCQLVGSVTR